jgi:hypothetical protein
VRGPVASAPAVRLRHVSPQWNPATLNAAEGADPSEFYRSRRNFQPTTVVLAEPLTWTTGASFQQLEMQFPAARTVTSNSVINTLRFHKGWEDSASTRHALDAGYNLRAATRILASDFVYVRHMGDLHYEMTNGRHQLTLDFRGGGMNGAAPMFERFVLGNASTLERLEQVRPRAPGRRPDRSRRGGLPVSRFHRLLRYRCIVDRLNQHGSEDKRGRLDSDRRKRWLLLALAFPIRSGGFDPVFIMGFNF